MSWLSLFSRRAPAIEPATARDAAAFAALHAASFARGWSEQEFERLLIERNALAHRIRLGRSIVGFIVSRCAGDEAEILSVAVAERQRGRGMAGQLLRTHLGRLAGEGIRTVFLEVEETNRPARQLYAGGGFRDVGRRENYYRSGRGPEGSGPRGGAAVVMRRDLT